MSQWLFAYDGTTRHDVMLDRPGMLAGVHNDGAAARFMFSDLQPDASLYCDLRTSTLTVRQNDIARPWSISGGVTASGTFFGHRSYAPVGRFTLQSDGQVREFPGMVRDVNRFGQVLYRSGSGSFIEDATGVTSLPLAVRNDRASYSGLRGARCDPADAACSRLEGMIVGEGSLYSSVVYLSGVSAEAINDRGDVFGREEGRPLPGVISISYCRRSA